MGVEDGMQIKWPDILVLVLYFVFVLAVGLISSWKTKRGSVSGYFLASRKMHWIPVGALLFASNIGSGHFIGLAGSGAASGIGIGAFELNADLYAGALFIQQMLNKNSVEWMYLSILILLAIASIFTITGGLTAVIWTDFVQTILMVVGACILMGMSFHAVGGYENLVQDYFYAIPNRTRYSIDNSTNCGEPPSYAMNLFRSAKPGESDLPWPGMLFGVTISGIWYWCTDQVTNACICPGYVIDRKFKQYLSLS
ncbi:solute carrier family 5 member 4-like isoform X3 [Homarus americanus]|uniref:solute carrier family 5 member 4-like isoform X3 n=1 Tax=Homarus americanus TaxID=6706 RepID=UPI001C43DDB1|nr:solute carrier family 5 member 4-like isoform X3 [Homarus americanus]